MGKTKEEEIAEAKLRRAEILADYELNKDLYGWSERKYALERDEFTPARAWQILKLARIERGDKPKRKKRRK